jgi:predicted ATPase/DNA-binding XRE family transcriptional regulator
MLVDEEESLEFGALLRRFRLARAVSQETLAERARLSVQSVSSLERGARRAPYRHTVNALADALGLAAEERAALAQAAVRPRGPRMVSRRATPAPAAFPAYATTFIGRESERAELAALIERSRLVVICGFGGIGKTRLAIEVGSAFAIRGEREASFVDFTSLRDPAHVVSRITEALRLGAVADLDTLVRALERRPILLVLDNCETVIDECARAVEALLRGCPKLRILATSREPFRVDGETLYRLGALDPGSAAVELFVDRVRAARASAAHDPEHAASVAIARRLDGIPLAIELAAGLARTRGIDEILASLWSNDFLTEGERRSAVARHQTMHAAISWSYDALDPEEQTDLRLLAYPPAGTTRAGALSICARATDRSLRRLVDLSLVIEARSGRFGLHEITKQFVSARRSAAETALAADRYAQYLAAQLSEALERGWHADSPDMLEPFARLVPELDNVRQAFRHALDSEDRSLALALSAGPDYWTVTGRVTEGSQWLERVDALCGVADDDARSAALQFSLMLCAIQAGRPDEALTRARRAAALAQRHDLPLIGGRVRIILGHVDLARGEARAAAARFADAEAQLTENGLEMGASRARIFRAFALIELGEAEAAASIAREHERRLMARFGSVARPERAFIATLLAEVARLRGELDAALENLRSAVDAIAGGPMTSVYARAVHGLAEALVLRGRLDEAQQFAATALRDFHERGFVTEHALLLEVCALRLLRSGSVDSAARVAYFADAVLRRARRTRWRFHAELAQTLHAELDAVLDPAERERLTLSADAAGVAETSAIALPDIELID